MSGEATGRAGQSGSPATCPYGSDDRAWIAVSTGLSAAMEAVESAFSDLCASRRFRRFRRSRRSRRFFLWGAFGIGNRTTRGPLSPA